MKKLHFSSKHSKVSWIGQWLTMLIPYGSRDAFYKKPKTPWQHAANKLAHERGLVTKSLHVNGEWEITPTGVKFLDTLIVSANK